MAEFQTVPRALNKKGEVQGTVPPLTSAAALPRKMVDYEDFYFSRICGGRTGFSTNRRTAYRKDPSSCYDGAIALSHRPLRRRELFEIRMDSLRADKWTGSVAIGTFSVHYTPLNLLFLRLLHLN